MNNILEEFNGLLSLNDIYNSTYKEIGYLRKHRKVINDRKNKADPMGLNKAMKP